MLRLLVGALALLPVLARVRGRAWGLGRSRTESVAPGVVSGASGGVPGAAGVPKAVPRHEVVASVGSPGVEHPFDRPGPSANGFDAWAPPEDELSEGHLPEGELPEDELPEDVLPEDELFVDVLPEDAPVAVTVDVAGAAVEEERAEADEVGEPAEQNVEPGLESELDALRTVEAELADVELALRRLDDGTYGRCEVCDGAIDDARLAEAPAARFCLAHLPISLG